MIKLALFAVTLAAGQLLFKRVAGNVAEVSGIVPLLARIVLDPAFLLAIFLYMAATILWVVALRDIPLSRAYAFTGLAFALVPIGAMLFFGETIEGRHLLGLALVLAGIMLVAAGGSRAGAGLSPAATAQAEG